MLDGISEVLAVLTNLRGGGIGELVTPGLTDLVKNGIGILGRLLQFGLKLTLERAAIGMDLAVDIANLVNDGNPPPC